MMAINKSFLMFLKQLTKDGMVIMMLFAPILAAFLFRFGIPYVEEILIKQNQVDSIIRDYYLLVDLVLSLMTPYLFCFAASLTMLDEFDENVINHIIITPVAKRGYLISRLIYPTILAFIISIIIVYIFSLTTIPFYLIILICFLSSLLSISLSLFLFSYSKNKVEGMTLAKLSGVILLGLPIPFFITNNIQYLFSFLPSFWIAKMMIEPNILYILLSLLTITIWIYIFFKSFNKKISK